jgi:hypothetical protein
MNPLLTQMLAYGFFLVVCFATMNILLKGFFWKYCRVRGSLGKLLLVKVRTLHRDYFEIGRIEEGDLVYYTKIGKEKVVKRLTIPVGKNPFYRSLSILWVDIDEHKNAICYPDYTIVGGFDSIKWGQLLERALKRPILMDSKEKIILFILIVIVICVIVSIYLDYSILKQIEALQSTVNGISGSVTPSTI